MEYCEEYSELITELAAGTLPETEAAELEAHIAQCPGCAALLDETRELFGVMKSAEFPAPSEDYTNNLADRVYEQVGGFEQKGAKVLRPTFGGSLSRILAIAASLVLLVSGYMYLQKDGATRVADQPETQDTAIEEQIAQLLAEQNTSFEDELFAELEEWDEEIETEDLFHEVLLAENSVDEEDLTWLEENFSGEESSSESFDEFFNSLTDEEVETILDNMETEQEHRTQLPGGIS